MLRCLATVLGRLRSSALPLWFVGSLSLTSCGGRGETEQSGRITAPDSAAAPLAHGAHPDTSHLLGPGYAGPLRVGMRVGELRRLYPVNGQLRAVTLRHGDADFPGFAVGRVGQTQLPAILLEPLCQDGEDNPDGSVSDNCRIWRITIRDPAYRTAAGLGVGSRYGDVRLVAPIDYIGPVTMGIAATSEAWQTNFLLDSDPIEARGLPLRKETIHDSVRVTGIQLFR